MLTCFKLLEEGAVSFYRRESFRQSIANLGGGTWKGIFSLTLPLFVMLIPFVGFGELQRVLGEGKMAKLFSTRARWKTSRANPDAGRASSQNTCR